MIQIACCVGISAKSPRLINAEEEYEACYGKPLVSHYLEVVGRRHLGDDGQDDKSMEPSQPENEPLQPPLLSRQSLGRGRHMPAVPDQKSLVPCEPVNATAPS